MPRVALVVDPHPVFVAHLQRMLEAKEWTVVVRTSFEEARKELHDLVDLIITNIKLGTFNGIHLVYLAKCSHPETLCIVHGDGDHTLGAEAQRAGAFYERRGFLVHAIDQYLTAKLPERDRRDTTRVDRRTRFRGGRRATDKPELHAG